MGVDDNSELAELSAVEGLWAAVGDEGLWSGTRDMGSSPGRMGWEAEPEAEPEAAMAVFPLEMNEKVRRKS
jgi:hypothetical protein